MQHSRDNESKPFQKVGGLTRIRERIIEAVLFLSASTAVFVIFAMAFYLFSEGGKLFTHSPVDEYIEIIANKSNPVEVLTPLEIGDLQSGKIRNWNTLSDFDAPVHFVNTRDFMEGTSPDNEEVHSRRLLDFVKATPGAIGYVFKDFLERPEDFRIIKVPTTDPGTFLLGSQWYPTVEPAQILGILSMILGTLYVTIGAIVLAVPISLGSAIYLSEFAGSRMRSIIKPVIEILAGIPSVVYGFFGLVVIVPFLQDLFNLDSGQSGLAGSIILALMIVPTIVSISEDALKAVPKTLREASLALGATKWQTSYKVVVPAAISGISTGVLLGVGRAIGETMAVLMVTGNAAVIPEGILSSLRTLTATIAAELGEAPQGGIHFEALFAIGAVLFLFTLSINIIADLISKKYEVKL